MRVIYNAVSYLFFPGTIGVLGVCVLFTDSISFPWRIILTALLSLALLPAIGVQVMVQKGAVSSLHMPLRKERTKGYLLAMLCWSILPLGLKFSRILSFKHDSRLLDFGILPWIFCIGLTLLFLGIITAWWFKISAHLAGIGGFTALTLFLSQWGNLNMRWFLFALLLSIALYLSRFKLSAHSHKELITGFCLGFCVTFAVYCIWI
jgi:hypothetical protein